MYAISTQVRKAIHVGDTVYYDISNHSILVEDIPVPSTGTLQNLLNEGTYRVLLYHGQLDVVVPYTETAKMVSKLAWQGARNFRYGHLLYYGTKSKQLGCFLFARQAPGGGGCAGFVTGWRDRE